MNEDSDDSRGVWKELPRRQKLLHGQAGFEHPPQMVVVSFKASFLKTLGRFLKFLEALAFYTVWRLYDKVRGKDTEDARGVRLREAFQRIGGTFIKLGQQLSLRADLLPYAYCRELSTLLDDVKPFPAAVAAKAIKDACGKELHEIFSAFDPEPVGSASIACVFQAKLKDGSDCAVKVRRPGIGEVFAADFRAMDWLAYLLEFSTYLRPGFTFAIRKGIRSSLMEEMDFRREARYQELFRRSAKKRKKGFISAPRVYPEYSGENVIVMELVTEGLKLSEVLAAVDQPANNPRIVQIMSELNIKPRLVARRLLWTNYAGMITDLFFHGDPSPGNIFVQRKSRLVFIDFGACGAFSKSQRLALKQINYHQANGDAEGMAAASLVLLEPLPPIDIDAFSDELEDLYQLSLYAVESKHSQWWERTTAVQWYRFLGAALEYQLPLPPVILRMARATLLYDTVAARLDNDIVFYDEYRRYERFANRLGGRRVREEIQAQLEHGIDDSYFMALDRVMKLGHRVVYRLERVLDLHPFKFIYDIQKGAYALLTLLKTSLVLAFATLVILGIAVAYDSFFYAHRLTVDFDVLWSVVKSPWYIVSMSIVVFHMLRTVLFRLQDKDVVKK